MRKTRIILVEGMPGTGKSTIAQFVNLQLRANGRPSDWCHEERTGHPVRLFYDPERHLSSSDYGDEAVSRWRSYANELSRHDRIAVLDAAIFQNHVRSMLLFDCDRNAIRDLPRRIENLLVSLDPVLIYLTPKSIEENFRKLREVRGRRLLELWIETHDRFPYARKTRAGGHPGFIAFWKEFGEISDRVFEGLTIPRLRRNVPNEDWDDLHDDVLDFLGLPRPSDAPSYADLDRFTGEYTRPDEHSDSGFVLRAAEGCLVASCEQPTMDVRRGPVGCFREILLVPKGGNRFHVAAWPHEVQFTEDERGSIVDMRVSIDEDGWRRSTEVYERRR